MSPWRWAVYRLSNGIVMPQGTNVRTGMFEKFTLIDEAECIALKNAVDWGYELEAWCVVIANDNHPTSPTEKKQTHLLHHSRHAIRTWSVVGNV